MYLYHMFCLPDFNVSAAGNQGIMLSLLKAVWLLVAASEARSIVSHLPQPPPAHDLQALPWTCQETQHPGMNPTNWRDCLGLANALYNIAPPRRKIVFSTEDALDVDYHVPISFTHESCSASILPINDHAPARDTFYSRYLTIMVETMAQRCVIPAPHLGGQGEIGKKKLFALVLLGLPIPATKALDSSSNLTAMQ